MPSRARRSAHICHSTSTISAAGRGPNASSSWLLSDRLYPESVVSLYAEPFLPRRLPIDPFSTPSSQTWPSFGNVGPAAAAFPGVPPGPLCCGEPGDDRCAVLHGGAPFRKPRHWVPAAAAERRRAPAHGSSSASAPGQRLLVADVDAGRLGLAMAPS